MAKGLIGPMAIMNMSCYLWVIGPYGKTELLCLSIPFSTSFMKHIPKIPMPLTSVSFSAMTSYNGKSYYPNGNHDYCSRQRALPNAKAAEAYARIPTRMPLSGKDGKSTSWPGVDSGCDLTCIINQNTTDYAAIAHARR